MNEINKMDDFYFRKCYCFQYIIVMVVCYNTFCIRNNGAIYKLVVILVSFY